MQYSSSNKQGRSGPLNLSGDERLHELRAVSELMQRLQTLPELRESHHATILARRHIRHNRTEAPPPPSHRERENLRRHGRSTLLSLSTLPAPNATDHHLNKCARISLMCERHKQRECEEVRVLESMREVERWEWESGAEEVLRVEQSSGK